MRGSFGIFLGVVELQNQSSTFRKVATLSVPTWRDLSGSSERLGVTGTEGRRGARGSSRGGAGISD